MVKKKYLLTHAAKQKTNEIEMVTRTAQTQKLDATANGEASDDCGILKFLFYTMYSFKSTE